MKKKAPNWTPEQEACIATLEEWACGAHHLPKVYEFGRGVAINFSGDLSTFDFDRLTTLVLLAHRDAVRIEITWSGPMRVKIVAHKRKPWTGTKDSFARVHPTLAHLIERATKLLPHEN